MVPTAITASVAVIASRFTSKAGTTVGTITNAAGIYTLVSPSPTGNLVFSALGHRSETVAIDGSTGSGVQPTHTYVDDGSYDVELTVTDDDGATGRQTRSVAVSTSAGGDIAWFDAIERVRKPGNSYAPQMSGNRTDTARFCGNPRILQ